MKSDLTEIPGILKDVTLAPYTTWKVGGAAKYFWEPSREFLPEVLQVCADNDIRVWYLGRGSNVLIDDAGLDGLVICTKRSLLSLSMNEGLIRAEAGVPMPTLSKFASKYGYGGYEFLIGIPGTVGAGIAINAGLTAEGRKEISDVLEDVDLLDNQGIIKRIKKEDLRFGYRDSEILETGEYVLSARFNFTYTSSKEDIRSITLDHLKKRKSKQPLTKPTAGSTFKQPEGGKPAGWYIDKAGLKGWRVGGAKISEKHANWIENCGTATSDNILNLMSEVKEQVYRRFQIQLEEEVRYLS